MYAIITLKDIGGLVCAEPLVVIRMDMENQGRDVLILPDTRSGFGREMLIISASVDPEDPAESLNTVLETEFMYSV